MPPTLIADGMLVDLPRRTKSGASVANARKLVRESAGPVTRTMTDTPRVFGTGYNMRMNKAVATGIGLGIDGQTQAYMTAKGKLAKDIFSSKYVPMTDGSDLLTSCPQRLFSQKGYGNIPSITPAKVPTGRRIGFDNNLVSTATGEGIKVSCATTKTYANHSVTSDFPKGPGGVTPAPMWEDGTYDEMIEAVKKRHTGLPEGLNFMASPDIRREVFNLQALTGASTYGNALVSQEIAEGFAKEKQEIEISKLGVAYPEATYAELLDAQNYVSKEQRIAENAKRLGISLEASRALEDAIESIKAKQRGARQVSLSQLSPGQRARVEEELAFSPEETREAITQRIYGSPEPKPGFGREIGARRTREAGEREIARREAVRQAKEEGIQRSVEATLEQIRRRDTPLNVLRGERKGRLAGEEADRTFEELVAQNLQAFKDNPVGGGRVSRNTSVIPRLPSSPPPVPERNLLRFESAPLGRTGGFDPRAEKRQSDYGPSALMREAYAESLGSNSASSSSLPVPRSRLSLPVAPDKRTTVKPPPGYESKSNR